MSYSSKFDEALRLAHDLHRKQVRKGSGVPYVHHLLGVASIVGEYGGSEALVIAALLHDAPEDQGGDETLSLIEATFGEEVAVHVQGCTDTLETPKPAWEGRKKNFIASIQTLAIDTRLIISADKLANLRSMNRDYHTVGEELWDRFFASKEQTLWYYNSVLGALSEGWEHPILIELEGALRKLERLAGVSRP